MRIRQALPWSALAALAIALGVCPCSARAQLDASTAVSSRPPELVGPSADELAALRPLALQGAAIIVRDADQGPRARITLIVHAHAPIDIVRTVVTSPEQYPSFMPTLSGVEIVSRRPGRIAFRFHVNAVIFDVTTLSALHIVNDHRVDVAIVQSDIGPGSSRWDLFPDDEGGTFVALSTWGDPSQGNWMLRQVARWSPNAIAGMNISADTILALGVARRAEILAGRALPPRPRVREVPVASFATPLDGAWRLLARNEVVASVTLDEHGSLRQSTVAMWTPVALGDELPRLAEVEHYSHWWPNIRELSVVSRSGDTVRYRTRVATSMSELHGEEERTIASGALGPTVWWHGVAGDFTGSDHRWDLAADPRGGTVVMLTGGSEYQRASFLTRSLMDTDVWLTPGFAASYKLVLMRPIVLTP